MSSGIGDLKVRTTWRFCISPVVGSRLSTSSPGRTSSIGTSPISVPAGKHSSTITRPTFGNQRSFSGSRTSVSTLATPWTDPGR